MQDELRAKRCSPDVGQTIRPHGSKLTVNRARQPARLGQSYTTPP
jgi:hypothetical protein